MKLLTIAPNDLRIYDGTTVRITGLVKNILPHVEKVYLASTSINNELARLEGLEWVRMKFLRAVTLLSANYLSIVFKHVSDASIARVMIGRKPFDADVIHGHWILTLPLAVGIHKYSGAPIIVDLHGLFELQSQSTTISFAGWLMVNLSRVIERAWMKDEYIYAFTVPSVPFKHYVISRYGLLSSKVYVVPDGIDIESIPSRDESLVDRLRVKLGIRGKRVVTYVGTVSYFHGFHDLLEAFKIARRHKDDLILLLIVPSKKQALDVVSKAGLGSQVIVLENIPRREVYNYLYMSDVLVIPHRAGTQFELLPSNKLFDYIASGKPIVGYNLPSIRYVLQKYEPKILVEPNNPKALATGILSALQADNQASCKLTKAILSEYSWNNIAMRLLRAYREVVRRA